MINKEQEKDTDIKNTKAVEERLRLSNNNIIQDAITDNNYPSLMQNNIDNS